MKKYLIIFMMLAVVAGLISCNDYGTKFECENLDLYYTDNVTKEEAVALGLYIEEQEYAKGEDRKTMQLNKEGDVFQVRMVIKDEFIEDKDMIETMEILASEFSQKVFDGDEVEIHMCDDKLKTQKVVKME